MTSLPQRRDTSPSGVDEKGGTKVDLVEYDPSTPTDSSRAEEERQLVRKLDKRILPIICAMYFFAYLDRTNLGNARLQGLPEDALGGDPTGVLFDWVNSAFFFPYVLCQVPAILLSKLCPPRLWLGCVAVGWGLCSTLMAAAFNFPGLMIARIGLGVFEAGFSPGFPLYFGLFYTREEIGMRVAWWFAFAEIAGAFSGLIAFGVQHAHTSIANWRLLFIIEGIPTVLLGLVAMVILPNRPEETKLLNEKEREIAIERINRGAKADVGRLLQRNHIKVAFKDWKVYSGSVMYFGLNCATAGITGFLPTIIKTFGFTNTLAQLLTVPPYAVAAICLCLLSYVSDRIQDRGSLTVGSCFLAGIGYVLLLVVPSNNHVRYFATFCITTGAYCGIGLIISWYTHNFGSETKKAAGTPLYMSLGQGGSILGSHLFPSTEGPRYIIGFAVTSALLFLAGLAALNLTLYYRRENKRRNSVYGEPTKNATVDVSVLADEAEDFRYTP